MLGQISGHFGHGGWGHKLIAFARAQHGLGDDVALQAEGGHRGAANFLEQGHVSLVIEFETRAPLAGLNGGVNDGFVTGASAQIAAERIGDVQTLGLGLDLHQVDQAHHDARGTKPALRAVAVHHRLLHRVQAAIRALQAFHSFNRLAIQ